MKKETETKEKRTVDEILKDIENGTPFQYNAALTKNRIYTVSLNSKKEFVISCNQLKSKEVLSKKRILSLLINIIEME